jgi:alkanesulfonate monooxygenase SsuD/methylene tetrahydromethanopterin reductase-like flavin-dependent oxidoreductase (luciferase family)
MRCMNDALTYGVLLPTREALLPESAWMPSDVVDFAVEAEALGFDSVWAGDAMVRRLDALAVLAAVAPATRTVRLGTAAMLPILREPLVTAQAVATVDQLSQGRVVLGVGAGFPGLIDPDLARTGGDYRTRYSRLEDIVALWRQLWSPDPPSSFHGRTLQVDELPDGVRPYHPGGPPLWFAGATPAGLERTGRHYDGWLPYPPDPADYAGGLAAVRSATSAAGRPADAVTPALMATVVVEPDRDRARQRLDEYCHGFYGSPLDYLETIQVLVGGSEEDIVARLSPYVAAGARHILLRLAALDADDQFDQLERIARSPLLSLVPPRA